MSLSPHQTMVGSRGVNVVYLFHYEYKQAGIMHQTIEEHDCIDAKAAHDLFFARGKELGITANNLRRATFHPKDNAPSVGCYRGNA